MVKHCPECGAVIEKKRSLPQHRRLFALMRAAYHQWPERHEFRPESAEHLRAWLLCKAGWHTAKYVDAEDGADPKVIAAAIEAAFAVASSIALVRVHGDRVAVYAPRSQSFADADQRAFAPIAQAVEEIIEEACGVSSDALLKEKAA